MQCADCGGGLGTFTNFGRLILLFPRRFPCKLFRFPPNKRVQTLKFGRVTEKSTRFLDCLQFLDYTWYGPTEECTPLSTALHWGPVSFSCLLECSEQWAKTAIDKEAGRPGGSVYSAQQQWQSLAAGRFVVNHHCFTTRLRHHRPVQQWRVVGRPALFSSWHCASPELGSQQWNTAPSLTTGCPTYLVTLGSWIF